MEKKLRSRAYKAGFALGKAVVEMVHLMYQNQTAGRFYDGLQRALADEIARRGVAKERADD